LLFKMEMIIFRKGIAHTVLFDECDAQLLSEYAWNINRTGYAVGRKKGDWKTPQRTMHLIIMGIPKGDTRRIDHKDCNPLNNKRDNLRFCTCSENSQNRRKTPGRKSKYLGVAFHRSYSCKKEKIYGPTKIRATIGINHQQKHLGYFETEEDAARAYDAHARILFGEFARVNFPRNNEQSALSK